MNKDEWSEELQDSFAEFAGEYPQSALALLAGLLVGLIEYSVKNQGGDEKQEIKIDGFGARDITISAVVNPQVEA